MAENEAEQAATPTEKKFGKLNSLILVVVILLLEGGTIFITVKLAGGPKQASGMVVAEEQEDPAKQIIEQLVVEMRAPNMKTGKTYLYDFTVVATFKQEDLETVCRIFPNASMRVPRSLFCMESQNDDQREPLL